MTRDDVFIVGAKRTPVGSYLGSLSALSAPELGAIAVKAALEAARVPVHAVDEVFLGNVLSAGIGQAPARQAAIKSGLPDTVPCTTISKVCGSGLMAALLGARMVRSGDAQIVVAGGMESMSRVPYYLQKARTGYRMGNDTLVDGMIHDGLWDSFHGVHMGSAAERCAKEYELTRAAQDDYAKQSFEKALAAARSGAFDAELVSVSVPQGKGESLLVSADEGPPRGKPEKFASLRPAFDPSGTITAANASSLNDGAAAVVLASGKAVEQYGLTPLARVVSATSAAQAPEWFTTAPAKAVEQLLARAEVTRESVDLFEINEAFACVTLACAKLLRVPLDRVNVNGGAVALGHPIGASGARVLTTLVHALGQRGLKRGIASLCIGGGEGIAMLVERVGNTLA